MESSKTAYLWGVLRIAMGFIFLWAFLDKMFGLGFSTSAGKSWLDGVSPTAGFLQNVAGPFAPFYKSLAGSGVVDWLFMLGLLGLGIALVLGIGMKIAGYAGGLLMLLMWSAGLFPKTNPILDDHIIYLLVLLILPRVKAGDTLGLGNWWKNTGLVKRYTWLE